MISLLHAVIQTYLGDATWNHSLTISSEAVSSPDGPSTVSKIWFAFLVPEDCTSIHVIYVTQDRFSKTVTKCLKDDFCNVYSTTKSAERFQVNSIARQCLYQLKQKFLCKISLQRYVHMFFMLKGCVCGGLAYTLRFAFLVYSF